VLPLSEGNAQEEPVQFGHCDIEDRNRGTSLLDQIACRFSVVRLAHHIKAGLRFDDLPQAETEDRVIIRDNNAGFILL